MGEQASKPPRWVDRPVNLTLPLKDADTMHAANIGALWHLRDDAGALIGEARVLYDVHGKQGTIGAIRYDANKATEAEAMQALERVLRENQ